ncbi:E3 Ubiquitin ligase family protein [Halorhabdus sp. SVX81]|uniref:hypothetical protein n=1 Tax=Halorhabdus sp. SVX81 TaxID=2978283 RepID=UPI0023DB886C|nr:hypothetical protein [Halorhabdus sp. SVX81]WEL17119.1 E3 Ubiquitin ligase family protein [Halorhabdus sp. SVX81]
MVSGALLFAGGLAVAGVALLALGARELWFAWQIHRGEPLAVFELPNELGPVEVQGIAKPDGGTVESPISGSPSLVCEWEVQEHRTTNAGEGTNTHWKTLDEGLVGGPFRLADDTASCRVEPAGSVRHLEEQTVTVPGGTPLPDRLAEFVAENPDVAAQDGTIDLGVTELKIGNDQRFVERRLDPGEKCYVYGRAHYDAGAGHRGGEVNVVINGDGVRRFLIADGRERGVAWDVAKIGSVPVVIGVGLLALAVVVV